MKATAKQIFQEIKGLNPNISSISSLGEYISKSDEMISESIYKEIIGYLPQSSLAYNILSTSDNLSEKQLWVIAFELEKNEKYNQLISVELSNRQAKSNQKKEASKTKLQENKSNSQSVLDLIKSNGRKLADYYLFVKNNKKFSKEFYSKKFSQESAYEFLSL